MTLRIESTTSPESVELIQKFLASHRSGVLATADKAANPHAAVVYYTFNDDFTLLFSTKSETQKLKNIEENKQVAFAVYDEVAQTVVQISGDTEIVNDEDERQKALNNMFTSSTELSLNVTPPAEKLYAGDYVAVRIFPQVIKMAVYARPDSEGDDLFETVLFSK